MGIFSRLFSQVVGSTLKAAIESAKSNQGHTESEYRTKASSSLPRLSTDSSQEFGFEVVGEKFHQENFSTLRKMLKQVKGDEVITEALMRCDPTNPFSKSGKAVEVLIQDLRVGYVPEYLASLVFEDLQASGGARKVKARVYFDLRAKWQERNSVVLSYILPQPSPKKETRSPEALAKSEARKAANLLKRNEETARLAALFREQMESNRSFPSLSEGSTICFSKGIEVSEQKRYEKKAIRNHLRISLRPDESCSLFIVEDGHEFDWQAEAAVRHQVPIIFFSEYRKNYKHLSLPGQIEKLEPPLPTISFASDTHLGRSPRSLVTNPQRLPQQTLAKYPTFTDYGSFNFRLVKLEKGKIIRLFEAANGQKTDGLVIEGEIRLDAKEVIGGELLFYFKGEVLGSVASNEKNSYLDSYQSWRDHPVRVLVLWDFKGNFSASHDAGLISAYKR